MYRIVHGTTHDLDDAVVFLQFLNNLKDNPNLRARNLFDSGADLFVTRAPGRLDVMGGIADYSGSLVLEMPLQEATFVALQRSSDRKIRIVSVSADSKRELSFELPIDVLQQSGKPLDYEVARQYFKQTPGNHWAAYVAGAFLVLSQERKITFSEGARILISSRVPEGKGVSSSAALEVAVMQAVTAAFAIKIEPRELALLCQKVENLVAGAPCGIMDQMTSVNGEANRLLALLCQPAEIHGSLRIPERIRFWGIDSGIRHSVAGSDYGSVRTGAFMGFRIIADLAELEVIGTQTDQLCNVEDPRWDGYLANLTPSQFEAYASSLPESIPGGDFLARFRCTTDPVTRIDPRKTYQVRVPSAHPVYEHQRVRSFAELLKGNPDEGQLRQMGELMYQSHDSYSACGLNSERTDLLVRLVREAGSEQGLYGAKITGGGSGGTVAVLGEQTAGPTILKIVESFARETAYEPYIFKGSSPGSAAFGHLQLALA